MLKQLSIFVENEVGSLSKVTRVLKENNINLRAVASFDSPEFGILRIVVDKPETAKELLTTLGFAVKVTEVLALELEDKPGNLDTVLHIIAQANVQVNYIYSFVLRMNQAPLMIMNLSDMEKATNVLIEQGVRVIEDEIV